MKTMEKTLQVPDPKPLLVSSPYTESAVRRFWEATDKATLKAVNEVAKHDDQRKLPSKVRKKLSVNEKRYLQGASALEMQNILGACIEEATQRQGTLQNRRQGQFRVKRNTTTFLSEFQGYVKAYAGVIQLMNGAGPGYGDAAYGALSLFLVVAVNKQQTEEIIGRMLQTLQYEYDRIQLVKEVYPSAAMKHHTAMVYRLGIDFLYEAIRYYSFGTFRRLWHILGQPPNIKLEDKVAEIKLAIEELWKEMQIQDGMRLHNIEEKTEHVEESIHNLQESVHNLEDSVRVIEQRLHNVEEDAEVLRSRSDNDRLDILRALLSINIDDPCLNAPNYQRLLDDRFDNNRRHPPLDVERRVFVSSEFINWRRDTKSSMFLLSGNTTQPEHTRLSWLSPAAVSVVRNFEELFETSHTLIRYFCKTADRWADVDTKTSPCTVLSSLVYQILSSEKGKYILRDEKVYWATKRTIDAFNDDKKANLTTQVHRLYDILGGLMRHQSMRDLVIVVDRIDQIIGDVSRFLDPLLNIMQARDFKVKVLLTVRCASPFDDSQIKEEIGEKYRALRLDQGES